MGTSEVEKRPLKGGTTAEGLGAPGFEPIAAPIPTACRVSGLSRSEIYRRLAAGDLRAVKSGSRTLILMDSLRAHLASLPAATFRAPRAA
jgi:excisionase family DNA binding protein